MNAPPRGVTTHQLGNLFQTDPKSALAAQILSQPERPTRWGHDPPVREPTPNWSQERFGGADPFTTRTTHPLGSRPTS